jgi:hypothetical protein
LGVILMGVRIAEVDQEAVSQMLRYLPVEAVNDFSTDLMIGPDYLTILFGVEPFRERS